jgi:hypothetical protein
MSNSGVDPTIPLVAYNGTIATGGNSKADNLNIFYNVSFSIVLADRVLIGTGWRHRVGAHINCACASHDPGSWVRKHI